MARETWVYDSVNKCLVPKGTLPPKINNFGRGPMVIGDEMESLVNMADGKRYTSKRKFEGEVRARGLEIVGNENSGAHTAEIKPHDWTKEAAQAWSIHGGEA